MLSQRVLVLRFPNSCESVHLKRSIFVLPHSGKYLTGICRHVSLLSTATIFVHLNGQGVNKTTGTIFFISIFRPNKLLRISEHGFITYSMRCVSTDLISHLRLQLNSRSQNIRLLYLLHICYHVQASSDP